MKKLLALILTIFALSAVMPDANGQRLRASGSAIPYNSQGGDKGETYSTPASTTGYINIAVVDAFINRPEIGPMGAPGKGGYLRVFVPNRAIKGKYGYHNGQKGSWYIMRILMQGESIRAPFRDAASGKMIHERGYSISPDTQLIEYGHFKNGKDIRYGSWN